MKHSLVFCFVPLTFTLWTLHGKFSPATMLDIPSVEEKNTIVNAFVKDLESFTLYDEKQDNFLPVICCVCDSMPHCPQWHQFVPVPILADLLKTCKLGRSTISNIYPAKLLNDYQIENEKLKDYILSPSTYINDKEEALICKSCLSELEANSKKKYKSQRYPPKESIINGYAIGNAPFELSDSNNVELTLTSRLRIYSQSWVFFAGCHQHIKGWHTLLKNQPENHVGNLQVLQQCGMEKVILVALCGPFTATQRALTLKKTAVDPRKVIRAWEWLKANNFRYKDDVIPHIDTIPKPQILGEKM